MSEAAPPAAYSPVDLSEDPSRRVLLIEAGPDFPPGKEPADIRDTYYLTFFRPDNFWPQLRAYFLVRYPDDGSRTVRCRGVMSRRG